MNQKEREVLEQCIGALKASESFIADSGTNGASQILAAARSAFASAESLLHSPVEDAEGWVEHGKTAQAEPPLSKFSVVQVRFRDGRLDGPGNAGNWLWDSHESRSDDIVAYRVVRS